MKIHLAAVFDKTPEVTSPGFSLAAYMDHLLSFIA